MKKLILSTVLSLAAMFTLFIGMPASYAHASEATTSEILQDEQFVTIVVQFTSSPPLNYYYDDGFYKGYISRVSFDYVDGKYHALYAGRVYKNAPIGT
ncbi:hypothetical protein [Sporosarcina luteola]|uniref:hypothetical protein n=1 Tax=Sporosarcina luteola TaxID=582850 RepID=UPI00203E3E86|nr:hypothetical protein [Sporosarcina luteola]MCM3712349.1 hypothetical protein [Sporosarcina luteola]